MKNNTYCNRCENCLWFDKCPRDLEDDDECEGYSPIDDSDVAINYKRDLTMRVRVYDDIIRDFSDHKENW